ncbi:MAG: hypothetical protein AAF846_02370 [Chloroflexota bacterium]
MNRNLLTSVLILMLTHTIITTANTDWDIIERCASVGEANTLYQGEILLNGSEGVHVVSAESTIARIRIFADYRWVTNWLWGANSAFSAISPDGQQIVFVEGSLTLDCPPCWKGVLQTYRLLIYDTGERGVVRTIPYELTFDYGQHTGVNRDFQIVWLNDNQVMIPQAGLVTAQDTPRPVVSDIQDGSTEFSVSDDIPFYEVEAFSVQPNGQYTIVNLPETPFDRESYHLIDITTGDVLLALGDVQGFEIAWHPDGTQVAVGISDVTTDLYIIDLETLNRDVVVEAYAPNFSTYYHTDTAWSHDGRYLKYVQQSIRDGSRLHIVDVVDRVIYDTCVITRSTGWSPSANQVALTSYGSDQLEPINAENTVQIFDLATWQVYPIATHEGHIMQWIE